MKKRISLLSLAVFLLSRGIAYSNSSQIPHNALSDQFEYIAVEHIYPMLPKFEINQENRLFYFDPIAGFGPVDSNMYGARKYLSLKDWTKFDMIMDTYWELANQTPHQLLPWALKKDGTPDLSKDGNHAAADGDLRYAGLFAEAFVMSLVEGNQTRADKYGQRLATFFPRYHQWETFEGDDGRRKLTPGDNWVEKGREVTNLSYYGKDLLIIGVLDALGMLNKYKTKLNGPESNFVQTCLDLIHDYTQLLEKSEGYSIGVFPDFVYRSSGKEANEFSTGGFDAIRILPFLTEMVRFIRYVDNNFGVNLAGVPEILQLLQVANNAIVNRLKFLLSIYGSNIDIDDPKSIREFFKNTGYFWDPRGNKRYEWQNVLSMSEFPAIASNYWEYLSGNIQEAAFPLIEEKILGDNNRLYNMSLTGVWLDFLELR